MSNKNSKIVLEDQESSFSLSKSRTKLNISFNRISFIFFLFSIISIIFTIHLTHLGSRKSNDEIVKKKTKLPNNLYRADILDREGNYLSKSVSSIDVGISPSKIIDKKRLILNLKLIFPKKDYSEIKKKLLRENFFILKKKFLKKIMKN